jgi:riboflavin biosynthesis pyrimidine reductase
MRLEALGGHLVACKRQGGQCDLGSCLTALKQRLGLNSILIEGGAGIIQSVLEEGLADQVVLTLRPCFFGGYRALRRQLPKGPASLEQVSVASIGGDVVMHGLISYPSHDAGDEAFTPPSRSLVHLLL